MRPRVIVSVFMDLSGAGATMSAPRATQFDPFWPNVDRT